jgi:hypothetical protein
MSTTPPPNPFPFAKLPTELRLMIYERLPIRTTRHNFSRPSSTRANPPTPYSFAIVSQSTDLSILRTCSWIHTEASAIMHRKLECISHNPPRLIVDLLTAPKLHKPGGPLWHISHFLAQRAVKNGKSLMHVPYLGTGMGSSGVRYDAAHDPDYARLARLVGRWCRSLAFQRAGSTDVVPCVEIAITAPTNCSHQTVLYGLRQLAYVLFAEHGGFGYLLRSVEHAYPMCTEEMRKREENRIDKVMLGRRGGVVRAVQGCAIDLEEFQGEWSDGSYYYAN